MKCLKVKSRNILLNTFKTINTHCDAEELMEQC